MKAFSEFPVDLDVLDRLADINEDKENNEKSADYLDQIIAIDPEYGIVKFRQAYIRFEIGEKEPFNEIINMISDEEQLRMLLGMFDTLAGNERIEYTEFNREELIKRSEEAREKWVVRKSSRAKK